MITGVKFGDLHCQNDLGMLLAQKDIGLPEVQTTFIPITGRNGSLDLTEALTGEPKYNDRIITLTFVSCENISRQNWAEFLSTIANAIHGKRLDITFDDDPDYHYTGRCEINQFTTSWGKQEVVIDCTCDPFKYDKDGNEASL